MDRKRIIYISALTVIVVVILWLFVSFTLRSVDDMVTQDSFDRLGSACRDMAVDLQKTVDMDRTTLYSMAAVIARDDDLSDPAVCGIMKGFSSRSYVSYVELLRPDNTALRADGTTSDASGVLDFAAEAAAGARISGVSLGISASDGQVLRNGVPVSRDGQTVGMLYGVVRLDEFAQRFKTSIYGGKAYVFLEDGDTGEFLLDTWHPELGCISDFTDRQTVDGSLWQDTVSDLQNGVGGRVAFVSDTIGKVVYIHYEPVGVGNWNVLVMIPQELAMKESEAIRSSLYLMSAVIAAVLLLYVASIAITLLKAYRHMQKLGTEDLNTGLLNRNAYDKYVSACQKKVFDSITCVYIDVNGLHQVNNRYGHAAGDQMLRVIADALKAQFSHGSVYRIGGDEFIIFSETDDKAAAEAKMGEVSRLVEAHSYSIAYGVVCYNNEMCLARASREADELMLRNKREYYTCHDRRQR